ncbi:MAG: NAD-dependent epimerase/dehydratase family protein [Candidatus Sericytochromatia bacterium]
MKIFVTGGGGFLGQAIVRQLLARGDQVVSYSRQAYPELQALGVEHRQGDLGERHRLIAAMKGCEAVMHVAAKAGIWGKPQEFYQANVLGTENVLAACQYLEIPRLLYTSSPSVVHPGHSGIEGANESIPYPEHFLAEYPRTKALAEKMVLTANGPSLATAALRPHLIWGPGDPHFVPRLVARARAGRLRLVGSGDPLVDTVYIDNAAESHLLALDALAPGSPVAGKAYFITQGEPVTISRFLNGIVQAAGLPPVTRRIPAGVALLVGGVMEVLWRGLNLPGEPLMTRFLAHQLSTPHWFDISAAKRDFGYAPKIGFDEGLERLALSLREPQAAISGIH